MKIYQATLLGRSPYSQSKHHEEPKQEKEQHDAYDTRTWRSKMHADEQGNVFIPPMAIKNCLSDAAKYLGIQIPGKGKSTYTKHFEAGVLVVDPVFLGVKINDVKSERVYVPSDGKRGGGSRVWRTFPFIARGWRGEATIYVLDETITRDVLERHLREAGSLIGIGRFRPRNNGFYGRFTLEALSDGVDQLDEAAE